MERYDIWVEGYAITGQTGGACKICTAHGEDFADACERAHLAGKFSGYGDYDEENLTLWGCKLFDNELDARANFG